MIWSIWIWGDIVRMKDILLWSIRSRPRDVSCYIRNSKSKNANKYDRYRYRWKRSSSAQRIHVHGCSGRKSRDWGNGYFGSVSALRRGEYLREITRTKGSGLLIFTRVVIPSPKRTWPQMVSNAIPTSFRPKSRWLQFLRLFYRRNPICSALNDTMGGRSSHSPKDNIKFFIGLVREGEEGGYCYCVAAISTIHRYARSVGYLKPTMPCRPHPLLFHQTLPNDKPPRTNPSQPFKLIPDFLHKCPFWTFSFPFPCLPFHTHLL